jgi:4-amino-4-deoxy-L-arabinose transferase-like glycosyltransferase
LPLALLVAVNLLVISVGLSGHDLIVDYPFLGGDSQDWIANGLFLAGEDVRYSARPPLLPLLIAGLVRAGGLWLLPVVMQILVHLTAMGSYFLFRRDLGGPLALLLSLAWLLNSTWQQLSFEIMADVPAICLLALGLFWLRLREPPRSYVAAGLAFGASALVQPLAMLVAPAALLAVAVHRRNDLRSPWFWTGTALLVVPTLLWTVVKAGLTGTAGDVLNRHWSLLGIHGGSLSHYLFGYASMLGLPGALLAAAGFSMLGRASRRDAWALFVTTLFLLIGAFFVFFYGFRSHRFLAYLLPLSYVFIATFLGRIRAPSLRLGLAAAVLLWSLAPYPNISGVRDRLVLWPLPPVYAVAPTELAGVSPIVRTSRTQVRRYSVSELLSAANYSLRYGQPRRRVARPAPIAAAVGGDRSAVYFFTDPVTEGQRLAVVGQRGNLLLRKVKFVPFSAFARSWDGLDVDYAGSLIEDAVYRVRIPGRSGSWLAVTPRGGRGDLELGRLAPNAAPAASVRDDVRKAEEIAAQIGGRRAVLFAPAAGLPRWQLCLMFLVETTEVFVVEPAGHARMRKLLGHGTGRRRSGDVELVSHEVYGWPVVAVEAVQPAVTPDPNHPG